MQSIDENLYSRQLYVLDKASMSRLISSTFMVVGLDGLGQEIVKNLAIMGVGRLILDDPSFVTERDFGTGFLFRKECIGMRKDECVRTQIRKLNKSVEVEIRSEIGVNVGKADVVVLVNVPFYKQKEYEGNVVSCSVNGMFGQVFVDFGEFRSIDTTGEESASGFIESILDGIVTTVGDEPHGLGDGDVIEISENTECNGMFKVEVVNSRVLRIVGRVNNHFETIVIDDISGISGKGGGFSQLKIPQTFKFRRLADILSNEDAPPILCTDDSEKLLVIHQCFITLSALLELGEEYPSTKRFSDAYFVRYPHTKYDRIVEVFARCKGTISPVCSVAGGFASQEAVKAVTHKFTPVNQFLYFDFSELYLRDDAIEGCRDSAEIARDSACPDSLVRHSDLIDVVGLENAKKIFSSNVFVVGAGAIGCEHLKNLAMLGVGTSKTDEKGFIYVTDTDSIEVSNLSRQFLFHQEDVLRMKSVVASEKVKEMNSSVNIVPLTSKVGGPSAAPSPFDHSFYKGIDIIASALDNVEGRLHVDGVSNSYRIPFFDSGTLGTKGNAQVIIPFVTENYSASSDPPDKGIPLCTIRNFPNRIEHAVEWAVHEFSKNFSDDHDDEQRDGEGATMKPDYAYCVKRSIRLFDRLFNSEIRSLLEAFPPESLTEKGLPFWAAPKRIPHPISFERDDEMHVMFLGSCSRILSMCYAVEPGDLPAAIDAAEADNDLPEISAPFEKVEFEKDDDLMVDFVYSCSTLRARCYGINEKDRLTVKRIAGKIVPAIATTTAVVSGLSCIEMMKAIVFKESLRERDDDVNNVEIFKNYYVNIAGPYVGISTPMRPAKGKVKLSGPPPVFNKLICAGRASDGKATASSSGSGEEEYGFTQWDRFEFEDTALKNILRYFENAHSLKASVVMVGQCVIFVDGSEKCSERMEWTASKLANAYGVIQIDIVFESEEDDAPFPLVVAISK